MIQIFWANWEDIDWSGTPGWYWNDTSRPNEDPNGPFETMALAAKDEAEHRAKSMLGLVRRGWLR